MKISFLKNTNPPLSKYFYCAIALFLPQSAHAHGGEAVVFPLMLVALIQLIPAAHLIFRRAWSYSVLYVLAIPFIWFSAWVIGMGLVMLGGVFSTPGFILGIGIALILPFILWRRILKWI